MLCALAHAWLPWTILALFAFLYLVCLLSAEWAKRWGKVRAHWGEFGGGVAFVLGLLFFFSMPLGVLHRKFTQNDKYKIKTDLWIFVWGFLLLPLLWLSVPVIPSLAILALMRLLDILYILVFLMINPPTDNAGVVRPAFLRMINYLEVTIIFACFFEATQGIYGFPLFERNGCPVWLTRGAALYFSLTTGATIGYGDIVPSATSHALTIWLRPSTYVGVEVFCVIFLTLISIPFLMSRSR